MPFYNTAILHIAHGVFYYVFSLEIYVEQLHINTRLSSDNTIQVNNKQYLETNLTHIDVRYIYTVEINKAHAKALSLSNMFT